MIEQIKKLVLDFVGPLLGLIGIQYYPSSSVSSLQKNTLFFVQVSLSNFIH